jgi:Uma2 family endonuclease
MSESTPATLMTLKQFEEQLMDGERWVELVEGRFVRLNPPDEAHGDVVRNLSRPLAAFLKRSTDTCACFELPLVLKLDPPTVRCPAVSCFQSSDRFAETENLIAKTRPVLVIEVASTNERREAMADRVRAYLDWGVAAVWVIDPVTRHVHQFQGQKPGQMLKEPQVLLGQPVLSGFALPVSDLFRQPSWVPPRKVIEE